MNQETQSSSGWAIGWTAFAGLTMIMMGGWWVITGLVAVTEPSFYVATADWVFKFDPTTWGWIHLLTGIVLIFAGYGVFNGSVWARTVGVIVALVAAVAAFAWLPWHPVWGVIHATMAVAIIWSLTVHGRDITA